MRWRALLSLVLVVALVAGYVGPALAAPVDSYSVNRDGYLTWRYRMTGREYEVRVQPRRSISVSRSYLTEGLGNRPVSLNEAAAVATRAAQAKSAAVDPDVQRQMFSIFNSILTKARFIAGAIADVWRAYDTYDSGEYMTLQDRYEAWKALGIYEKYNAQQIMFINQRIIPVVRMMKLAEGVVGSALVGIGLATLAAGALAIAGITAPVWAVAGGLAAVVGGIAALNIFGNVKRHAAGQNMLNSKQAAALTGIPGLSAFLGSTFLKTGDPYIRSVLGRTNQYWSLTEARQFAGWAAERAAQGNLSGAAKVARYGLGSLARFLKGQLAGIIGEWLLADATRDYLRAVNLGTIPLPEQVVATRSGASSNERVNPDSDDGLVELQVRLVPST